MSKAETRKRYEEKNKEQRKLKAKAWRDENPTKVQDRNLKAKYGISLEEFKSLIESQNYKCLICNTSEPTKWCVDHEHSTGLIRGILCHKCNTSLGHNGDSLEKLEITYAQQRNYLLDFKAKVDASKNRM